MSARKFFQPDLNSVKSLPIQVENLHQMLDRFEAAATSALPAEWTREHTFDFGIGVRMRVGRVDSMMAVGVLNVVRLSFSRSLDSAPRGAIRFQRLAHSLARIFMGYTPLLSEERSRTEISLFYMA